MSNTQFVEAIWFLLWFLTVSVLASFAFLLSNYAPNEMYPIWILLSIVINVACVIRWFNGFHAAKRQEGE